MTYKEENKLYDELMDILSLAFVQEVPLERLKKVERVFNEHTWTDDHSWMIDGTLKGRIMWAERRENKKMVKVYFKNILYFESIKDYVKVVTLCKTVITKQQLSYFESSLNNNKFLRIHRSFIVATDKIDAYSLSGIDVGDTELPIGRKYKETVIEALENLNNIKNN